MMQSTTSTAARAILERARAAAAERRVPVSTLHLLGATLDVAGEVGRRLRAHGVRIVDVRQALRAHPEPEAAFARVEPRARRIAQAQGSAEVTEGHLLAAALSDPESAATAMLAALRHDPSAIAAELVQPAAAPARAALAARTSSAIAQGQRGNPPVTPLMSRARLSVDARRVAESPAPSRAPSPRRRARRPARRAARLAPRGSPPARPRCCSRC
ncbi:MAG: Clp protease N-terminal domain-containing protein [Polyangiales bacterium]